MDQPHHRQVSIYAEITTSAPDTIAKILTDHNPPQPADAATPTSTEFWYLHIHL